MPPMLGDMVVQMLGSDGQAELVGRSDRSENALADARRNGAQLLIVHDERRDPAATLAAAAGIGVLAIAQDAHDAALFSVTRQATALDRSTLAALALKFAGHG